MGCQSTITNTNTISVNSKDNSNIKKECNFNYDEKNIYKIVSCETFNENKYFNIESPSYIDIGREAFGIISTVYFVEKYNLLNDNKELLEAVLSYISNLEP